MKPPADAPIWNLPVWVAGAQHPRCYYITEDYCGERTICDCPSCPIRCALKSSVYQLRAEQNQERDPASRYTTDPQPPLSERDLFPASRTDAEPDWQGEGP